MGAETKLLQSRPNSTQARKGMRRGHPELAVECPQCHSPIGRTCFMGPGYWGITHVLRKLRYREEGVAGSNHIRLAVVVLALNGKPPGTRQTPDLTNPLHEE